MTREEFYKALRVKTHEASVKWSRGPGDILRARNVTTAGRAHCPLSFVAGTAPCEIYDAAAALGLNLGAALYIAGAADNDPMAGEDTRRRLLAACGLEA